MFPERWQVALRWTVALRANRCCIVSLSHQRFQITIAGSSALKSALRLQNRLTVLAKRQSFLLIYTSKQTFSMRSRCVVTWLSAWLSVWLACDTEWHWQVKRFQRVFCGWATCWSRAHMRAELTFPEDPTDFKGVQPDYMWHVTTPRPLNQSEM